MRVLFVQFANPAAYPPIEHAATCLRRAGAEVRFLGVGFPETRHLQLPETLQQASRLLPSRRPGPLRRAAWTALALRVVAATARWRPDWIYVSDPLVAPIAVALRRGARRGIVYHEHDEPAAGTLPHWVARARLRILRDADVVVMPNAVRLQRALVAASAADRRGCFVVWNAARAEERRDPPAREARPLGLWFHGSISPTRLPPGLLDAVRDACGDVLLEVAGYPTPDDGWIERVVAQANAGGVEVVRRVGPHATRADLLDACAAAHFGVCCYASDGPDPNQRNMAGASNKVFDYLARGLGLLVSDAPQWRSLLGGRADVVFFDPADPGSCAQALRAAAELAPRLGELRSPMPTWEDGFAPVLERMCS